MAHLRHRHYKTLRRLLHEKRHPQSISPDAWTLDQWYPDRPGYDDAFIKDVARVMEHHDIEFDRLRS